MQSFQADIPAEAHEAIPFKYLNDPLNVGSDASLTLSGTNFFSHLIGKPDFDKCNLNENIFLAELIASAGEDDVSLIWKM